MRMRPFEEIVAEHGAVVLRVCRALLPAADADDAWSETFIAALRAYPDLRPDSNVRGWLVTIAQRKAIDQIRRRNRQAVPAGDLPDVPVGDAAATVDDATDPELTAALETLGPKQRGAVLYHYVAGLAYAEVGRLLETSEEAARRSAADGIAKLRLTYLDETSGAAASAATPISSAATKARGTER